LSTATKVPKWRDSPRATIDGVDGVVEEVGAGAEEGVLMGVLDL
jgi:hypothetical protein